MAKAYWRGKEIYWMEDFKAGWAKIAFWDADSYFTGTGGCWARLEDIIIEDVEEEA